MLLASEDLLEEVTLTLVLDAGVESAGDGLPVGLSSLLERGHGDPIVNVKHGGLVVLLHQLGDSEDELGVESGGLLDVALVVVDDSSVEASSGELLNAELLDQSSVGV